MITRERDNSTTSARRRGAIVGLGKQAGEDHLPALMRSRRADLVAVCDIDSARGIDLGAEHGVPVYRDHRELLESEDLDFVLIAAPHEVHREIVLDCINAGVHVLKEKPFAMSFSEAAEIAEAARLSGIAVMTTLQRRFNPIYQSVPQLIEQIGTVFFVEARYTLTVDAPHAGWRGSRASAGGGCLIDMGYHMLDLLLWYFGMPSAVAANISCHGVDDYVYDAEDTACLLMKWPNEVHGSFLISRCIPPKSESLTVLGTEGRVELTRGEVKRLTVDGAVTEHLQREISWTAAATTQIDYFCGVLDGDKLNIGDPDYHLKHAAIIEASYEAARTMAVVDPREMLR